MKIIWLLRGDNMRDTDTVISLQLPKDLVLKIKEEAANMGLSMTAYIRLILIEKLK